MLCSDFVKTARNRGTTFFDHSQNSNFWQAISKRSNGNPECGNRLGGTYMQRSFLHAAKRLTDPVRVAAAPPTKDKLFVCRSRSSGICILRTFWIISSKKLGHFTNEIHVIFSCKTNQLFKLLNEIDYYWIKSHY